MGTTAHTEGRGVMAKNGHFGLLMVASAIAVAASILVLLTATQPVEAAFPGTNGRIVFERDPDGYRGPEDPEIYTISFAGDNLKRLTNNSTEDTEPTFSADGTKIVYSGDGRRAPGSYSADLFVMKAGGSGKIRVTREREIPGASTADDLQPAFSPSGRRIVFVRSGQGTNSDIFRIGTDGSNPKRLVDIPNFEYRSGGQPAWSPDGTRIAFFSGVEDDYSIETVRPDGTARKHLTTGYAPNWSSDGSRIAFHRSPDGSESRIHAANADGSGEEQLTTEEGAYDSEPAYSPGGGKIVFSSDRDGDYDLYVMDADGTDVRQLTNHPGTDWAPDWQAVQ
jgi:Tol biopolymer transport system component